MSVSQNHVVSFESLENRELMSVGHHHHHHATASKLAAAATSAALTITQNNSVLTVLGSTGNDQISISQNGNTFTLRNGTWTNQITGSFTKVVVKGNGGNDSINLDASVTENADLYGGVGNDTITGGNGNDRI